MRGIARNAYLHAPSGRDEVDELLWIATIGSMPLDLRQSISDSRWIAHRLNPRSHNELI